MLDLETLKTILKVILLLLLIVCAISVCFSKDLLVSIVIFMSYSLIMSIIWMLLESPDLAITEAAVGADGAGRDHVRPAGNRSPAVRCPVRTGTGYFPAAAL